MPGQAAEPAAPTPVGNPYLATVLSWLVPGAGHFYLGRRLRALAFLVLVLASLVIGWRLEGRLPWTLSGAPLQVLATLGCLGSGIPVLALRFGLGYEGTVEAAGFEYGGGTISTGPSSSFPSAHCPWSSVCEPQLAIERRP